jgi:mannan endo-1,4-beta-mannosidase
MNLDIDTIDFGTFHLYPDSCMSPSPFLGIKADVFQGVTSCTCGNGWITAHGAACAAAGKPCLLEGYGVTSNHCSVEAP